jgi:hypothetical protein
VFENVWRLERGEVYGIECNYEKSGVIVVVGLPAALAECRARLCSAPAREPPFLCLRSR